MMAPDKIPRVTERLLKEATSWGDMLCREAFWHADRCSWIGRSPEESPQEGPLFNGTSALGPDFYAGTAGVAVFLAHLNAANATSTYRDTALGAVRHARYHADAVDPKGRLGLHTGVSGIAYAMVKTGQLLDEPTLVSEGAELARAAACDRSETLILDFISGTSSAICSLLGLHRSLGDDRLRDCADVLGQDLVRRGSRDNGAWIWSNADLSGAAQWPRMLNGLAHGASGVAIALLELYVATGRVEYLDAGRGAFAYEDQFVDTEKGNWQDLRGEADEPGLRSGHTLAWCHGAPGIALARLRAMELLPDLAAELRPSIAIAMRGTETHATTQLKADAFDVTSCHGLAGLIEPFVMGSRVLGDPSLLLRARMFWADAIRRREERATWLSGVGSGGKNHSLMIGIAGAGYGLLRAYDPQHTPSVLLPS